MLAPDAPARYQQGMHRNGEVYDMEREVHIIQTPAAPELHLPSNLMPGMVEVQEEYQQVGGVSSFPLLLPRLIPFPHC